MAGTLSNNHATTIHYRVGTGRDLSADQPIDASKDLNTNKPLLSNMLYNTIQTTHYSY